MSFHARLVEESWKAPLHITKILIKVQSTLAQGMERWLVDQLMALMALPRWESLSISMQASV